MGETDENHAAYRFWCFSRPTWLANFSYCYENNVNSP